MPAKSRISLAQNELSPLPYDAKSYVYSPEFLAPPSIERALRAHTRHPDLKNQLEALTFMNQNVCLDSEKDFKTHAPREFQGQFFNSIQDFEDFVDVTDAALLHMQKDELYSHPNDKIEQVLIAGGGPAGMLAAIESVLHGHDATVVEAHSTAIRMRLIGIYPEDVLKLARFGAPIELFYDMFAWCEKDAAILYDIENYLVAIALKLGVRLYRNALVRLPSNKSWLQQGIAIAEHKGTASGVELPTTGSIASNSIVLCVQGTTQNIHGKMRFLHFDTIIDCSGSKRAFAETLTGRKDIVDYMHVLAGEQLEVEKSREFYLDKDEEHISKVMGDMDWTLFAETMEKGRYDPSACLQNREVTAFTSNMPRDIFRTDAPVPNAFNKCPPDWVCIPMPYAKSIEDKVKTMQEKQTWGALKVAKLEKQEAEEEEQPRRRREAVKETDRSPSPRCVRSLSCEYEACLLQQELVDIAEGRSIDTESVDTEIQQPEASMAEHFGLYGGDADIDRVQFEGMCPRILKNSRGETMLAKDFLGQVNKDRSGDILWAYLECCVGSSSLDEAAFETYVQTESSWANPTQNTTAAFTFVPKGLRTSPDTSKDASLTLHGTIPGSATKKYYILGDACGDPWFRWGIGVHDACYSVRVFSLCLGAEASNSNESEKVKAAYIRELELRNRKRHVHSSGYYWHFGRQLENHPQMIRATSTIQNRKLLYPFLK